MVNSMFQTILDWIKSTYLEPSLRLLKLRAAICHLEGIKGARRILIPVCLLVFVVSAKRTSSARPYGAARASPSRRTPKRELIVHWARKLISGTKPVLAFSAFWPPPSTLIAASLFVYRPWCHFAYPFGLVFWLFEKPEISK